MSDNILYAPNSGGTRWLRFNDAHREAPVWIRETSITSFIQSPEDDGTWVVVTGDGAFNVKENPLDVMGLLS